MPESAYDCVVIGSGPGGYVAAIRAAQLGMKTAVVEKDAVGGRCLNYACIPAKAVLRVADVLSEIREADEFGIKVGAPEVDFDAVMARRDKVVSTLTGGVAGLMKKNKIDVIEGVGSLAGRRQGRVGGRRRRQDDRPRDRIGEAADPGHAVRRPRDRHRGGVGAGRAAGSMAVVGAGASGAEIASAYARLGVEVLLFEALDRVLPTEDADISKLAERGLKKQGMEDPHQHVRERDRVRRGLGHVHLRRAARARSIGW